MKQILSPYLTWISMTPRSGMRLPDALYNVWALALAESSILREYFSIKLWPKRLWLEPVSGVAFAWNAVSAFAAVLEEL